MVAAVEYKEVLVSDLEISERKIREIYDKDKDFEALVRSVGVKGVEQDILCRPSRITDGKYEIADGNHRKEAAIRNGITKLTIKIKDMSDEEMMVIQQICNTHRIKTSSKDELEHLKGFVFTHEDMTHQEVADLFCMDVQTLTKKLKIAHLTPKALSLVNKGKIKPTHAYSLATLPKEEQEKDENLHNAMTMPADKFVQYCIAVRKACQAAAKEGKEREGPVIVMVCRKKEELQTRLTYELKQLDGMHPDDTGYNTLGGVIDALQWTLSIDPDSLALKEQEKAARKKASEETRLIKKTELADKALAEYKANKSSTTASADVEEVAGV